MSYISAIPVRPQPTPAAITNSQANKTTDGTLEAVGDTTGLTNAAPTIERNISELNAKIETLKTTLQNAGVLA